jgi:predicted nuclease of restriction endonuclease-like RecB superfamily
MSRRAKPTGKYRSKLESVAAEALGKKWIYEAEVISYLQPKDYLPDFTFRQKENKIYVEVKGFFRSGDASKYRAIHNTITEMGYDFVMVFANPDAAVRKGSQTTYRKWAEKNGIPWYGINNIHNLKRDYGSRS